MSGLAAAVIAALVVALLTFVPTAPVLADSAPHRPAEPATVTADRLPTVQVNGVVWSQVIVGSRVYVTGQFTHARPAGAAAGQNQTARSNILAYDINTGALVTSWAPSLNAQGRAISASADGSRIYVGGDFSSVSGVSRNRVVALNAQTGAVITTFNPGANNRVASFAVNGNTLYMGGHFSTAGGQSRSRLAAVNATTGALLPWAPSADREIVTMAVHPGSGRVIVGGSFTTVNGVSQRGMTSIDGTSGAVMPWQANQVIQNYGPNTQISSLISDGQSIYGVGWAYFGAGGTTANFEGTFAADPLTGTLEWINGCRGDQFAIALQGDVLYTTGHSHDCGMIGYNPEHSPVAEQRALAFDKRGSATGRYNAYGPYGNWQPFAGRGSTDPLHWLPNMAAGTFTGSYQAGYHVTANDNYVVYGGEFPRVNGVNQQGLVRFAKRSIAPNTLGPEGLSAPTVTANGPGVVRVAWTATHDRDNERLRYEVLRGSTVANSTVIGTYDLDTNWWTLPPMAHEDATATPGTNQTYRIRVRDPLGNTVVSGAVAVAVPGGTRTASEYGASVRANGAIHHWRLDEASGTLARDSVRSNDLTLLVDAQRGAAGGLLSEPTTTGTTFPASTSTSIVRGTTNWWQVGPQTFSVEAWFKTTSTQGGKIIGFGSSQTGRSGSNETDRHIYMTNSGQLRFGLRPDYGTRRTIDTAASFNNGAWHHVVATLGASGANLYVDGELVAQDASITKAQVYQGYWRVGGDRLSQWPSAPTREAFEGSIDEVAVYPAALSQAQVRANYQAAGYGDFPNEPPAADFDTSTEFLEVSVDGAASVDPDGVITTYSWNFGDGATGTGVNATHTYAAAGDYTIALTVTDNRGASDTTSELVTVSAPPPNQLPTAAFTVGAQDLQVSVDATGSTDPDGTISTYAWNFGDSTTGSGSEATHVFAEAGTYTVVLTVTDDRGGTDTETRQVTVTAPVGPVAFASDTFERTTASGWGSAQTGGAWSLTGSGFSVSGGAGRAAIAAGQTRAGYLTGASARDFELVTDVALAAAPTGGGAYITAYGRRVSAGNDYSAKVRYQSNGQVIVYLARTVGNAETTLQWVTAPGLTVGAGDTLRIRFEVTGLQTTTASAKVWRVGTAEPANWLVTNTSATPAVLQATGHVGLTAYLSSSWASGATQFSVDNFVATPK